LGLRFLKIFTGLGDGNKTKNNMDNLNYDKTQDNTPEDKKNYKIHF